MIELIERIRRLLQARQEDNSFAVDFKQTREEIEQERQRADEMMAQLDQVEMDLDIAENEASDEGEKQ